MDSFEYDCIHASLLINIWKDPTEKKNAEADAVYFSYLCGPFCRWCREMLFFSIVIAGIFCCRCCFLTYYSAFISISIILVWKWMLHFSTSCLALWLEHHERLPLTHNFPSFIRGLLPMLFALIVSCVFLCQYFYVLRIYGFSNKTDSESQVSLILSSSFYLRRSVGYSNTLILNVLFSLCHFWPFVCRNFHVFSLHVFYCKCALCVCVWEPQKRGRTHNVMISRTE